LTQTNQKSNRHSSLGKAFNDTEAINYLKDTQELKKNMPRTRKRNALQKAAFAVLGVLVVYISQYTPDPVVKTGFFILGLAIVLYAVAK
jgi:hypothetical protein